MPQKTAKRTQIYLTTAQHRAAMALARARNTSLAALVRDAIDRYLSEGAGAQWDGDPALALIGAIELPRRPPGATLAREIDRVVYEEDVGSWSSPTAPASS